ncbi:hypothetical protein BDN71DRAFT_1427165 [Pleurotus eryngii]|uniref:DNA 3'-5' helicase n=1 Tax=Pleurotus eryngii TaxID=5323 RepID=A0A9P6AAC4_PLEER|nr:hypothetical protein BDN71DRAFT_1427165 [Pleurotus eryngii]
MPEPEVGSSDWFHQVISRKLGYSELRDWQVELARKVFQGKEDIVCVAGTGSGKSALLHIPLMAMKVASQPTLGIDSLRAATAEGHNLFQEIYDSKWDLFILTLELLHMPKLNPFFRSQTTTNSTMAKLSLVFVDECHLVYEHGKEFQGSYHKIGQLRGRLSSHIPWIAVTATLPPGEIMTDVLQALGFDRDDYLMHRMHIDIPNIKLIPRFLEHSISSTTMLDISWIIPVGTTTAAAIKKTVVFCVTIKLACTVMGFLESLLAEDLPDHGSIVMPFYSLMSDPYRQHYIQKFRNGHT